MSEKPVIISKLQLGDHNGKAHIGGESDLAATLDAITKLVNTSGTVIVEIIRSASNMPLLALLIGLWGNSLAYKLHLIDSNTNVAAFSLIIGAGGVSVTGSITQALSDLEDILPFTSAPPPSGLLVPGAKVLNYGGADMSALAAKYSGD